MQSNDWRVALYLKNMNMQEMNEYLNIGRRWIIARALLSILIQYLFEFYLITMKDQTSKYQHAYLQTSIATHHSHKPPVSFHLERSNQLAPYFPPKLKRSFHFTSSLPLTRHSEKIPNLKENSKDIVLALPYSDSQQGKPSDTINKIKMLRNTPNQNQKIQKPDQRENFNITSNFREYNQKLNKWQLIAQKQERKQKELHRHSQSQKQLQKSEGCKQKEQEKLNEFFQNFKEEYSKQIIQQPKQNNLKLKLELDKYNTISASQKQNEQLEKGQNKNWIKDEQKIEENEERQLREESSCEKRRTIYKYNSKKLVKRQAIKDRFNDQIDNIEYQVEAWKYLMNRFGCKDIHGKRLYAQDQEELRLSQNISSQQSEQRYSQQDQEQKHEEESVQEHSQEEHQQKVPNELVQEEHLNEGHFQSRLSNQIDRSNRTVKQENIENEGIKDKERIEVNSKEEKSKSLADRLYEKLKEEVPFNQDKEQTFDINEFFEDTSYNCKFYKFG